MPHPPNQSEHANRFIFHPKVTTALFFSFLLLIILLLTHQRYIIVKETRKKDLDVALASVESRLEQLLKSSQNIALTLALTLDVDGKPRNFEETAAEIIRANPTIQAVQLVPNGIVTYVYPKKGNEEAIGLDLSKAPKRNLLEIEKAIRLRKMYFQGPVDLMQGGKGVIGRLPIYVDKKFWGFSAVVIKLKELLNTAGIDNNLHPDYKFQFSKINPLTGKEEFFLGENYDFSGKTFKATSFEEGDWKVYLINTRSAYADFQLGSFFMLGLLLSFLSSGLLLKLLKNQAKLHTLVAAQKNRLIDTENKYKTIFDNAGIGIGRVDSLTGEFLEANAFLCKLLGYTAQELNHKKIKSLIHKDDLATDARNFKRLLNSKIRKFSSVRRYIHKNGEVIWANAIVSPLWEKGEQPNHHIVIIEDITQQVAYEEQLLLSKKHTEDIVNSIEGIVWEADLKNNLANTFISNKVYDILGYTAEEWVSEPHINRVHEEDQSALEHYLGTELFKRRRHVAEYRIRAKDGHYIWIRDIVTVEPSLEQPEMLRGIMIDITTIKEAEETLYKSFQLVNEQNKRLLNFSYIVSHNLRSHASNIDGITSLISNAETNEERDEMVKLLRKVVVNLNDTLYNLNNIVNIQTSVNLVKEPLNLLEYLERAIHTQEARIVKTHAEIVNKVSPDIFVNFNKAYMESVLLNIISNALRYIHPNRTPQVLISCEAQPKGWLLSIQDNGIGIDMLRNKGKLFGLNQTFAGNSDARGLGLFITKNQIEAMGGKIEAESEIGQGTTFKIFFAE